jgi:hypothetical protein
MRGDIDGDGKITENDRNRISEHLGGTITLTGADSWCAKVTGNNEISVSDLVQLMQYLEGKTNNLTGIPTFADYYNNWTYHKVDDLTGYWTAEVVINGLKTTSDAIVNISNDEGIFYKSELSDGAISFYATRPPIAEVPATITFKPGTGVITTSYESAKFHAATHSKDGADPIIPESIGALSLSGGTMTGSLILKDNPAKDLEAATKQYVDNHTSDTVLYTPQTLSDDQKTQARTNINAAPDGFGLGNIGKLLTPEDNLDEVKTNGWYRWDRKALPQGTLPSVIGQPMDATLIRVWGNGAVCYQESINITDDAGHGCLCARTIYASIIYPWEWVNPLMQIGVEYRTMERFWGKPVYYKIVDCGKIADNKQVEHGIVNMRDCISFQGLRGGMPMPSIPNNNLSDPWSFYVADVSRTKITLTCGTSAVGGNCHVMLKYTKTTD